MFAGPPLSQERGPEAWGRAVVEGGRRMIVVRAMRRDEVGRCILMVEVIGYWEIEGDRLAGDEEAGCRCELS